METLPNWRRVLVLGISGNRVWFEGPDSQLFSLTQKNDTTGQDGSLVSGQVSICFTSQLQQVLRQVSRVGNNYNYKNSREVGGWGGVRSEAKLVPSKHLTHLLLPGRVARSLEWHYLR